jgi:DNA-nicking Smr family endonuclease
MGRRKRIAEPARAPADGFHHQPFRQLKRRPPAAAAPPPPPPSPAPPAAPREVPEADLFTREMSGVRPLSAAARQRVAPPPPTSNPRPITDEDAEALAELSDLVSGSGTFDLANSVEFIEGAASGVDRRLVRRLRAGDFAYQSHVDLHGMTAEEARVAVDRFLVTAQQKGQRCVLIIHGRGLNSKDQVPVLKTRLAQWLARGSWARLVLAFTSARACDGGAGALYVLLRRQRHSGQRQPVKVTHGAKW